MLRRDTRAEVRVWEHGVRADYAATFEVSTIPLFSSRTNFRRGAFVRARRIPLINPLMSDAR